MIIVPDKNGYPRILRFFLISPQKPVVGTHWKCLLLIPTTYFSRRIKKKSPYFDLSLCCLESQGPVVQS